MSSNRKKNNKKNSNNVNNRQNSQKIQDIKKDLENEIDESDKIIEQLDKIEKIKKKNVDKGSNQDREDMSSKVKNLIKSDKEAIKKMQEQMAKIDEEDELDYLDDEKVDFPAVVIEAETKEKKTENRTDTSNVKLNKNTKKNRRKNTENISKESNIDKEAKSNKNSNREVEKMSDENSEEKDVNLDFFENMAREDEIHYNRIRKQQPNRLRGNSNSSVKEFFAGSIRNMAIAVTACVLLIILFISLIVLKDEGKDTKNYDFIELESAPLIETINNYYDSLGSGSMDSIRSYIYEGDSLSDAEILKLTEEQTFLSEFFFSDILDEPFKITNCYVLEGMKKKEYIVLMKYQFTIRDCTEPATGIFSWYMVDVSKDETPRYQISIEVGDTSSKIYRYVCRMENIDKVRELVDEVNAELVESCKKDEVLRKIIFNMYDEMVKSGDNIDDGFRNIILELKEYEESLNSENTQVDDSTTQNQENTEATGDEQSMSEN